MNIPDFDSQLPANLDAERTILGAILLDNAAHFEAAETVEADDFSLDSNRRIFLRMAELIASDHAVDIVTLAEHLGTHKEIESVGGVAYLASLTEGLPRRPIIAEYIRIVREKAKLRRMMSVYAAAFTRAADQSEPSADLLADVEQSLFNITTSEEPAASITAVSESAFENLLTQRACPQLFRVPTGCAALDDQIGGGWAHGELAVIAGRPGQGKSGLLTQTLVACGRANIPAHCFQLEMTADLMVRRMWASMTGINALRFRNPEFLSAADLDLVRAAHEEMARFPLVIDTEPFNAAQIVARARMSKRRYGTRFVGVDYLQRIRMDSKPEFFHRDVSDAAVKLANLAKREQVAVVALSSLTERGNAKPTLADLRQSGDIQYDAATVLLLHRETDEDNTIVRDGFMNIAKNRNGVTGNVDVQFTSTLTFERSS